MAGLVVLKKSIIFADSTRDWRVSPIPGFLHSVAHNGAFAKLCIESETVYFNKSICDLEHNDASR